MPKTRFTAADVRAVVRDLRSTVHGLRVVNVYDLDAKTYLFKLASPGQEKAILLMESGARFHTTKFTHEKSETPSGFSMKLRKHIRTQRLEDVRQVGMDRVVDFKFGSGEASHHVILELYASGNIILTDYKYEILDLLRTHTYDEQDGGDGVRVAVRQIYPVDLATSQEGASATPPGEGEGDEASEGKGAFVNGMAAEVAARRMGAWFRRAAEAAAEPAELSISASIPGGESMEKENAPGGGSGEKKQGGKGGDDGRGKKKGGGARKARKATLKQVLMQKGSGVSVYGPSVLEHCVLEAGLRPNLKLSAAGDTGGLSEEDLRRLVAALASAETIIQQLDRPGQPGYIQCKPLGKGGGKAEGDGVGEAKKEASAGGGQQEVENVEEAAKDVVYEEFLPQLLAQHEGALVHTFPSFDEAVDAFFGRIVEQKLKQVALAAEAAIERKVAMIRQDQEKRVQALEERQEMMLQHAQLAEAWADEVEKALMVVRSALANGMDWQDLDDLVQAETANGNPIASLIHELRLDRNKVVLSLPTTDGGDGAQLVEVDVMLSAHANARLMYENKKNARAKELKTLEASEKVLKIAEQQAQKALQHQAHKRSLQVARKSYWFEKFNWFITSENYLVLSGRDAQQNEVVVKKYLRPGDIYVHADLHGASSCVVRNKDPSGRRPVSPLALEEAGCMTVCRSGAWGAKMVTSAWWVYADQVSKTAPSGEYLVTGSFMVRGRKNFLPPRGLEMGFALLFRLDDSCLAAHVGERREKVAEDEAVEETDASRPGAIRRRPVPDGSTGVEQLGRRGNDSGPGDEKDTRRGVGFDIPVGLREQREGDLGSRDDEAAKRRAAALAALAGGGARIGGSADAGVEQRSSAEADEAAHRSGSYFSVETSGVDGRSGAVAGETAKKRLSAKERKQAKKGGAGKAKDPERAGHGGQPKAKTAATNEDEGGDGDPDVNREADNGKGGTDASMNASVPRGKRSKLKRMKKKYAEQDEEDRKLAMEALGQAVGARDGEDTPSAGAGGKARHREGDRRDAASSSASASAAAEDAASRNLRKAEAELAASLSALDGDVRARLEEVIRADELDPFEVRSLGRFDKADALGILQRFGEADLRRVRNRSGFLAGIMRKYGSASAAAARTESATAIGGPEAGKDQPASAVAVVKGGKVSAAPASPPIGAGDFSGQTGDDAGGEASSCAIEGGGELESLPPPVPPQVYPLETHDDRVTTHPTGDAEVEDVVKHESIMEEDGSRVLGSTRGLLQEADDSGDGDASATNKRVDNGDASVERHAVDGDECDGEVGRETSNTDAAAAGRDSGAARDASKDSSHDGAGAGEPGDEPGGEQLSRRAQKRKEEEEVRKLLEEEGAGDDADFADGEGRSAGGVTVGELDHLTGKPRDEDLLLYAVPVCGPYMSLRDYRYKVKLTPGKQKRGKASKQAIEVFSRARETPAPHRGLMKGVTDNECVAVMIGDVKVSVAGLAQATQAQKKANKKQAQKDPSKSVKQQHHAKGKGSRGKKK